MNAKDYQQYLLDLKNWSNQVDELLKNYKVDGEAYAEWKQEMENFMKELENKIELTELSETDLQSIEESARTFYEVTVGIHEDWGMRNSIAKPKRVNIGEHRLPPLPYEYDALEPYISSEIMKLHHDKHHQSYVDGLNKAEKMMQQAREANDFELIKHWEREAAFHGSGHYLHTIFWNNMRPNGGGVPPTSPFLRQIEMDFGSFNQFQKHFSEAAKNVEGVGWALLVWSPRSHRLEILQAEKHQNLTQWDTIPLLVLDVWEHAYYLQYKNERNDYVDQWWNVVNWNDVIKRFYEAKKLKWTPY